MSSAHPDTSAASLGMRVTVPRKVRVEPSRWMTLPMVSYLVVVTQVPFLLTVCLSFQSWNLMRPQRGVRFVGFANFIGLIQEGGFRESIVNSVIFTVLPALLTGCIGLGLALLLNRMRLGRGFAYGLLLMPFLVMETVSPIIWKTMILSPLYGVLAWIIGRLGLPPVDFIATMPRLVIIVMVVWQWAPFMMMILLAALQTVPGDLLEAAALDGAGRLRSFTAIVVPHLLPFLIVGLLLEVVLILPLFGPIYVATYGGPGNSTTNLMFSAYRILAEQYDVGKAAAAGIIAAILTIAAMLGLLSYIRPLMQRGH
jgi:sorbitol/mannitol transport system permease protein